MGFEFKTVQVGPGSGRCRECGRKMRGRAAMPGGLQRLQVCGNSRCLARHRERLAREL